MPYPPSAGAVGQRPGAEGDEPQPRRRLLSAPDRPRPRRAARHRHLRRFHRRLSRRDRGRIRGDAEDRRGGELCAGFLVQIFAAARHARGRDGRPDARRGDGRAAASACRRCSTRSSSPSTRPRSAGAPTCCSNATGRKPGQKIGKSPWLQSVHRRDRGGDRRAGRGGDRRRRAEQPGAIVVPAKAGISGPEVAAPAPRSRPSPG